MNRDKLPKPPSWASLKAHLLKKGPARLLQLIRDLYDLSPENRHFLAARFLSSDGNVETYRTQVKQAIYPDPFSSRPISIVAAKRAIRQYRRATGDLVGTLDLRLTVLEEGTAQAVDLGYGDDGYFRALELMLETALKAFPLLPPKAREEIIPRLRGLRDIGGHLGWGYGDFLRESLAPFLDGKA